MSRPSGTHLQSKGFSFIRIIIMMDDLIILLFDALMPKDLKLRNKTLSNSTYSKGVVLVIEKAKKETVLIAMEYRAC